MTAARLLTFSLSLFVTAVLFAQAPQAQTPTTRATEAVTAETDRDAADPRALQLSLDSAVRTSIERNLGVEVQRFESRMAGENLRGQYGLFDWFASATVTQSSSEDPTISLYASGGNRATRADAAVAQLIPTGGQYRVGWTNSRLKTTGGGTFVNPAYRSGLQFSFTQPLLRDFGVDVTRRNINIARNTLGLSNEAFRTALMNTATNVEQAYLDLVYARRNVEVVKETLFLARDQSRITQIRIDVGASAPLDILQPRVQIATTEESLIGAVASVRNAEDRLRALLNLPKEEWDRPIVPVDRVEYEPLTIDTEAAVQQALRLRPELRQLDLTSDTLRIQQLYARNQMLPTLDFSVGYGLNGLAGRTIELDDNGDPTGGFRSTGYTDTLSQIFGNDFPSWNVGFNVGVPITNIGARAAARAAELDLEQTRTDAERVRQNITVEV
ncbi:MAG: TolC family protein, partial [Thermoanaerobaculia bacterium]